MLIKNNKAFTLIELMVVISLLAIILAFALPNISSTLERNKKDQMINDAKDMVDKAKISDCIKNTESKYKCFLKDIDPKEEIKTSPFGKKYDRGSSYVEVVRSESEDVENAVITYTYNVYLKVEGDIMVENNIMCIGSEGKPIDISKFNESGKYNHVKQCS